MNRVLSRIERASFLFSNLVVLPEMFRIGKISKKNKQIKDLAETIPGPTTDTFSKISKKYRNYVVGTALENEDGKLFNTAFLVGPDGYIGKYRKIHLWDMDVYPSIFCPVRCIDNRVFIVAATQVGEGMVGQSMITDPNGMILSKGRKDTEQFVRAKLDLYNSRNKKLFINTNVILDRKPELYEILCSPKS